MSGKTRFISNTSHYSRSSAADLKLYTDLADWWPVLSAPADYAEEAEFFRKTLLSACVIPPRTLLELGSGGGNNASHLKAHFEMTLVDLSVGMLAVSQKLNPECEHHEGDLRNVRLKREFDAVFIQDAISYITSEADLAETIKTAWQHCRPGGAALFAPDSIREKFRATTSHGGHDVGSRSLRYLEYTWDPDPSDSTYITDMVYLLRDETEQVRIEHDRHILGLFARSVWLRLIGGAGFEASAAPFVHSEIEPGLGEIFLGRKPQE
jgi:ubiquinone/menaquinone biosynthesis C-methylase UbiE